VLQTTTPTDDDRRPRPLLVWPSYTMCRRASNNSSVGDVVCPGVAYGGWAGARADGRSGGPIKPQSRGLDCGLFFILQAGYAYTPVFKLLMGHFDFVVASQKRQVAPMGWINRWDEIWRGVDRFLTLFAPQGRQYIQIKVILAWYLAPQVRTLMPTSVGKGWVQEPPNLKVRKNCIFGGLLFIYY